MQHCSCGFEGWEFGLFSGAWYRAHADAHLAAFPESDPVTRTNLLALVTDAPDQ